MSSKSVWAMVLGLLCWASSGQADPGAPQPIHTNKMRFKIPYRFDARQMQSVGAREIRLYVSTDGGVRWQLAQTVEPQTSGRFNVVAPQDGEYWFAVRTLDFQNRLHPEGNVFEPGLKVIVDTTAPQLDVSLRQAAPGRVELSWQANDEHLDLKQLQLEYRQTGSGEWQQVSVAPRASGTTSWNIAEGGFVAVRGQITDLAANMGTTQAQARIEPANQPVPRPPLNDFSEPIASDRGPDLAAITPQIQPRGAGHSMTSLDPSAFGHVEGVPAEPVSQSGSHPVPPASSPGPSLSANTSLISESRPKQPRSTTSHQSWNLRDKPAFPAGHRARVVNTRQFQIGYKLDNVGPSGVSSVELYITQNDGAKWYRYGNDEDMQSPFDVRVPEDGLYGFAIRVRSGAGLSEEPPRPGEKPSIAVFVDQTPPVVELLEPQQGPGAAYNKLLIRWNVDDDHPAELPIALTYADNPNGPWEPITGWLPDTGSYLWTIGSGMPSRLYIRITARDSAGNVTREQTTRPVTMDVSKPTARIVDVEAYSGDGNR